VESSDAMLWQIEIYPADGQPDLDAQRVASDAADLGIARQLTVHSARGYVVQGPADRQQIERLAAELLADGVVERTTVAPVGHASLLSRPGITEADCPQLIYVLLKPGVMDPVALSAQQTIGDYHVPVDAIRTYRKYWLTGLSSDQFQQLCNKILANDSIENAVQGPLQMERIEVGSRYTFSLITVPLRQLNDQQLTTLSREGQLYLTLVELQTIQAHFRQLQRDPTDVELETIAQTWSEHCSHKTLAGRIEYTDESGTRQFDNMLKETIFAATVQIRRQLGADDWCVSVFEDNAGVVRFDDENNVVFKVETHNHPSALEPYGGANTGIGGVIRDALGTGLGAKPVCNTDVFCFAPPDFPLDDLQPGVQHPRRVMKRVVAGVRDYGNRMGIPTVNGAIYFDRRYLGNPLVFCGNVGILPREKSFKRPMANDYIVAIGGRTGRDGIHGATFSSAELTSKSETLSGGAVQIGNAIMEKMVTDVLLQARDRGLYHAVTDCGAGGFSSAVGEMGEKIGAEVWLDRAPVKYEGLSYTEIWISEAQERMVLSVPPDKWNELAELCASENVEATVIGRFESTGRLRLKYQDQMVADLSMEFLHDGRPPVVRPAVYRAPDVAPLDTASWAKSDFTDVLLSILGSWNVASKEWVIRQYDHEVQGGSVIKPLVGAHNDGPSDAAVFRPRLDSLRGLVISCGMSPRFGDYDTYWMAASAIDEAVRNAIAVGADPRRIAILDNFCWGNTDRPETLGSLVRAALACHDLAIAWQTPFISGKDSLNNEFSFVDDQGHKQSISIPPSLLISAMGQVDDVTGCVTMDLKQAGNHLYQVGLTRNELGGSHLALVHAVTGGQVPRVDAQQARRIFAAVHQAIRRGCVRACHDLSEGGLAVAVAEMAFAGDLGARIRLQDVPHDPAGTADAATLLFAESNSRFLCEVPSQAVEDFERCFVGLPCRCLGVVTSERQLHIEHNGQTVIASSLANLKEAWQAPLRWN
jgi:phosphoribosylformylglycinamidine synthase